jgi:hypothetical protein
MDDQAYKSFEVRECLFLWYIGSCLVGSQNFGWKRKVSNLLHIPHTTFQKFGKQTTKKLLAIFYLANGWQELVGHAIEWPKHTLNTDLGFEIFTVFIFLYITSYPKG